LIEPPTGGTEAQRGHTVATVLHSPVDRRLHGSSSNLSVGRETRPLLTQLAGDAILETDECVGNQRSSARSERNATTAGAES